MILESIREELEYNREKALYESIDVKELLEDYNELLEERVDMLIDMLNEDLVLNEALWDDLKIKKEDLVDPDKVKAILKKIEKEQTNPKIKERLLNGLYLFLLGLVGLGSGAVIAVLGGVVLNNGFIFKLGATLGGTLMLMLPTMAVDRHDRLMEKINKAIKKVDKAIQKEKDPENIKAFKKQKEVLKENLKAVKADKKRRGIKSHDMYYTIVY